MCSRAICRSDQVVWGSGDQGPNLMTSFITRSAVKMAKNGEKFLTKSHRLSTRRKLDYLKNQHYQEFFKNGSKANKQNHEGKTFSKHIQPLHSKSCPL
jgi:hypothetical protein